MTCFTRTGAPLLLILLAPFAWPGAIAAQPRGLDPVSPLYTTVADLDRAVFAAYNTCDLDAFGALFAEEVEFYHDQGGITRGRQALVASVKANICGKTRRELVADTLEVYPMQEYGALQTGSHRFCGLTSTRCEGIGRFIHLWQRTGDRWTITRVISYDHRPNP